MAENKTQATDASVEAYLAAIEDAQRQHDCRQLAELMRRLTGHPARMWGSSIVGFDRYSYRYDSGRQGEICLVGFSSRKGDISLYGTASAPDQAALLQALGRHKMGMGCLYLRKLADVDLAVLAQLIAEAIELKRQPPVLR